jgi:hypothetical protein
MRRLFIISIVVFSIIIASNVQAGEFFQRLYFVGLWQGVDDFDGSEAQRSITLNNDGTFNIIGQEPYTRGCGGERGKVKGTGRLEGGVIVSDDFTLTCFPDNVPVEGDEFAVEYKPNKLNGTLIESFPDFSIFPETTLHKISNR